MRSARTHSYTRASVPRKRIGAVKKMIARARLLAFLPRVPFIAYQFSPLFSSSSSHPAALVPVRCLRALFISLRLARESSPVRGEDRPPRTRVCAVDIHKQRVTRRLESPRAHGESIFSVLPACNCRRARIVAGTAPRFVA